MDHGACIVDHGGNIPVGSGYMLRGRCHIEMVPHLKLLVKVDVMISPLSKECSEGAPLVRGPSETDRGKTNSRALSVIFPKTCFPIVKLKLLAKDLLNRYVLITSLLYGAPMSGITTVWILASSRTCFKWQ